MRSFLMLAVALSMCGALGDSAAADLADPIAPKVDHHQHLLSARGAALLNSPKHAVQLPAGVLQVLQERERAWDNPERLGRLYSSDAVLLNVDDDEWLRGREAAAGYIGTRFARPYRITPVAYVGDERRGHLAAYYSRGEGAAVRHVGYARLDFAQEDGHWRIALEHPTFPGPASQEPLEAERLVSLLDAAHIKRAVVLSVAYWFDSPENPLVRSADAVRAENAWTAEQAARFPERLVAFCSLNPASDWAQNALRECIADGRFKGLKLHFGNSNIDLLDADHVRRVRTVFAEANRARLPIIVHTRGSGDHGAAHARVVLEELVAAAPDVPVQIAHLWGGNRFAPEALAVYAEAVAARRPEVRRLYFDLADAGLVANTPELGKEVADRIRQIGLDRILYGSDGAFLNHPDPQGSWAAFRSNIPLRPDEIKTIANNVAPYLSDQAH